MAKRNAQVYSNGVAGAAMAPSITNGPIQSIKLGANFTLGAPTNYGASTDAGRRFTLVLIQDATGSRTVAYNAKYKNPPALSAGAANTVAVLAFIHDGQGNFIFEGGSSAFV